MPAPKTPYQAKILSDRKLAALRPSLLLAPDAPTGPPAGQWVGQGVESSATDVGVPALTLVGTGEPTTSADPADPASPVILRRDGTERLGVIVPLDGNNRIFAKKLLDALDWTVTTDLVVEVQPGVAVVRAGKPTAATATLQPTRVDRHSRLRLPPATKGALQLRSGDQVLACAVPQTGELHLMAAADLLQQLTGVIVPPVPTETSPAAASPRTRVRPALTFD